MKNLYIDVDKIEILLCMESLQETCYQILGDLVHNKSVRRESQLLQEHVQYRLEILKKTFQLSPSSENVIQAKISQYLLQLKPLQLPLRSLINVAINLCHFKIDIYKHFSGLEEEQQELLQGFLQENIEEIDFLQQERNFHQNRMDPYFNTIPHRP